MGNDFDWLRDSVTVTLKAKDIVLVKYEITGSGVDSILWTAGHKWELGSIATHTCNQLEKSRLQTIRSM